MKITRRQLRRLIAEAEFTPGRPLNRDAMYFALGMHPSQIKEKEIRSHPFYEEGLYSLYSFIEVNATPGRFYSPEHIDDIVESGTAYLEGLYEGSVIAGRVGFERENPVDEDFTSALLQDLLSNGYVDVDVDDLVVPTSAGERWYDAHA
jgi:hypothetical protein|tara:strand:- start:1899 stop:2345 length:447 start_codon:yes stop_codon:yes gene_type:complete